MLSVITMPINSTNRGGRKAFFVCRSRSSDITRAPVIIALTLVLAGGFALPSQMSTTIPNALAQEEEINNNTITTAETTMTNDTTSTATTARTSSSGLNLSAQPVWDEEVRTTGIIPINETHNMAEFEGHGTMTVPDTGEIINMTNNGTAIGSLVPEANDTVISYGRENVFSVDDGDTSAITFFEIVRYDPTTFQGKGLAIAVFDRNATGMLAPFNGMMVVGTHVEDPSTQTVTIRLWEWETGIPLPSLLTTMEHNLPSPMNTTTTSITDATTTSNDTNATGATE